MDHNHELEHNLKEIYFVRHGEAEHNVTDDFDLPDPHLTPLGRQQARGIQNNDIIADLISKDPEKRAQLIITSPLRRTIQTAVNAFGHSGIPIICNPDIQETHAGERPCDTGRPTKDLAKEFANTNIHFSSLANSWWDNQPPYLDGKPNEFLLHKRLTKFTKWLSSRPEDRIIVVAHKGIFKRMFTRIFKNCEVKKYILKDQEYVDFREPMSLESAISMLFILISLVVLLLTLLVNSLMTKNRF